MPTIHKAQLTEPETPMLDIWDRVFKGLKPNARAILNSLGYYAERDLQIPSQQSALTKEEEEELKPIARALMEAAIKSVQMKDGVLVTTLDKVAKNPLLFFGSQLPAAVQWQMATDYQRADEQPGTFGMDIWGDEQTGCTHPLETPTEANITKAAEAARRRVEELRTSGRPHNPANRTIADLLGKIFRSSGQSIVRRRESTGKMFQEKTIYAETGLFYEFLELVLPPLRLYLSEQRLPPVTIESIVRFAIKPVS
jgi:hypothetical protein